MDGLFQGLLQGAVNLAQATKNALISGYQNLTSVLSNPGQAYTDVKSFFANAKTSIAASLPKILSADTYSAIYEYTENELNSYWGLDDYTRAEKAGELISSIAGVYAGGRIPNEGVLRASQAITSILKAKELSRIGGIAINTLNVEGAPTALGGFTEHGLMQIINRGVTPGQIVDALKNTLSVNKKIDDLKRTSYVFAGEKSTVILNDIGEVITAWSKH